MRRVWAIYFVRKLTSPSVKVGVLVTSFLIVVATVSIPNVIENAFHVGGLAGLVTFSLSAFLATSIAVQTAVVLASAVMLSGAFDFIKQLSPTRGSYA